MTESFMARRVRQKREQINSKALFCLWLLVFIAKELTIGLASRLLILINGRDILRMLLRSEKPWVNGFMRAKLQDNAKIYAQQRPNLVAPVYDAASHILACHGAHEQYIMDCLPGHLFNKLNTAGIAVDLGSNMGIYTCFLSKHFAKTYAFELDPKTAKILQLNVDLYAANEVEVTAKGVSDKNGTATGYVVINTTGNTSLSARDQLRGNREWKSMANEIVEQEFETCRVDDVIPQSEHGRIAFIKMDVEDYELQALRGMQRIMQESRPVIGFEALESSFAADGGQAVIRHLRELGYSRFYEVSRKRAGLVEHEQLPVKSYDMIIASHHQL